MSEKQIETDDLNHQESTTDTPATNKQRNSTGGIYTGEDITEEIQQRNDDYEQISDDYAKLVSIEERDNVTALSVELFDGTIEEIELEQPTDARLSGEVRQLYHYLGFDTTDPAELIGELIPIDTNGSTPELAIGVDPPTTNRASRKDTSSQLGGTLGRIQDSANTLRFIQAVLSIIMLMLLLLPSIIAITLSSIGIPVGVAVGAVVSQLCAAAILFIRAYL